MKPLLILTIVSVLFSCRHINTEGKIKSAIEKIERDRIKQRGEKTESFIIDSLD